MHKPFVFLFVIMFFTHIYVCQSAYACVKKAEYMRLRLCLCVWWHVCGYMYTRADYVLVCTCKEEYMCVCEKNVCTCDTGIVYVCICAIGLWREKSKFVITRVLICYHFYVFEIKLSIFIERFRLPDEVENKTPLNLVVIFTWQWK